MATSTKRNNWKCIELIIQVILISFGVYILRVALGLEVFSFRHCFGKFIPSNYFVILYCVVFLVSPFINILMRSLTTKSLDSFIIVIFVLFSVYPTAVDLFGEIIGKEWIGLSSIGMYGSQWGYSAINFMLMYCIGAYLRMSGFDKWGKKRALLVYFSCVFITLIWSRINDTIGFFTEKSGWEYCNPFVILMSVSIFIVFTKIKIGTKKWINSLARAGFTVFLTHGYFIEHVMIEKFVSGNVFIMVVHMLLVALILYMIGYVCFVAYDKATYPIWGFIKNKIQLPQLDADREEC